jgi:hypothetical protein
LEIAEQVAVTMERFDANTDPPQPCLSLLSVNWPRLTDEEISREFRKEQTHHGIFYNADMFSTAIECDHCNIEVRLTVCVHRDCHA